MQFIDKNICFGCGAKADEQHHVVPESMGGIGTVPLCIKCHDIVHGGLGRNRIQHKELTKRALNKKQPFDFHYTWWHHFKENDDEGDWKDIKEIAADLEVGVDCIRKRVKRLKEMDSEFLQELVLKYVGYEYYGTSLFNLEPYNLTDDDILRVRNNRKKIEESVWKELAMI